MDLYGPALPPGYVKPEDEDDLSPKRSETKTSLRVIGPQMPDFLSAGKVQGAAAEVSDSMIGPELPPHLRRSREDDDEEDEMCGPAAHSMGEETDSIQDMKATIEKRAEEMKNKLSNKSVPVKVSEREEWMVVPDTSRRNQLGAISRCLEPPKPSSKDKHSHKHRHSDKDRKTSEELKNYNKSRRSESLMDMHAKKMKKKEKKSKEKKEERKAFDRDEMAVRQFTKDQVNSVIDKAKYLNSRFAAGNSQYL